MSGSRTQFRILGPYPSTESVPLSCSCTFLSGAELHRFMAFLGFSRGRSLGQRNVTPRFCVRWRSADGPLLSLAETLRQGPSRWRALGDEMKRALAGWRQAGDWTLPLAGKRVFRWSRRTVLLGILNVTPDSFSDGGRFLDPSRAAERALRMQEEGADWIDVGGESTRPGSRPVEAAEEKKRILPVLRACAKALRIPLSVDTSKAEVARAAVGEGASLVNDIGALRQDPRMAGTVARLGVPVVLMHMKGRPRTMQKAPRYSDVTGEILAFLRDRVGFAVTRGVPRDKILVDPGFGFGKTPAHNVELMRRLFEFRTLGRPVLMGPSRKATLGVLLGGVPAGERLEATLAAVTASVLAGADWVRVHDVKETARALKVADAVRHGRGIDA